MKSNIQSKLFFYFLLFFSTINSTTLIHAQNKISIYFESGKTKIPKTESTKLNLIPFHYNLADLDSVIITGYADSLGRFESNKKLSEKRALSLSQYCVGIIPSGIPVITKAIGEQQKRIENMDRRAEISMFFSPITTPAEKQFFDSFPQLNGCYYIAYDFLKSCHIREIKKGDKEYILIETEGKGLRSQPTYYYGIRNDTGKIIPVELKWVSKPSGNYWWFARRQQTKVPKEDYENFKIFFIRDKKCNSCNINVSNPNTKVRIDSCIVKDIFLTNNIQFKSGLFSLGKIQMRAPLEFIDINSQYYTSNNKIIEWKQESGKRNRNYYFAKIDCIKTHKKTILNYSGAIYKKAPCCIIPWTPNNTLQSDFRGHLHCGGVAHHPFLDIFIGIEVGNNYNQRINIPYTGIIVSRNKELSYSSALAGIDLNKNLYMSLRHQYNYLTFPLSFINPVAEWENYKTQKANTHFASLFLGSELRRGTNFDHKIFTEQNVHTGLTFYFTESLIHKIFVQYGYAYDFSGNNAKKPYPLLQTGLILRLINGLYY